MTNSKHTRNPSLYEMAQMPHEELTKRVDQLVKELVSGDTRPLVCVNAMHGIENPEAFMRNVREYVTIGRELSIERSELLFRLMQQHLKGGAE